MEPLEGQMNGTSSPESISTKLQRIAELAKGSPEGHLRSFLDQRVRDGSLSRSEPMLLKSRMREIRTSGSVGGWGE